MAYFWGASSHTYDDPDLEYLRGGPNAVPCGWGIKYGKVTAPTTVEYSLWVGRTTDGSNEGASNCSLVPSEKKGYTPLGVPPAGDSLGDYIYRTNTLQFSEYVEFAHDFGDIFFESPQPTIYKNGSVIFGTGTHTYATLRLKGTSTCDDTNCRTVCIYSTGQIGVVAGASVECNNDIFTSPTPTATTSPTPTPAIALEFEKLASDLANPGVFVDVLDTDPSAEIEFEIRVHNIDDTGDIIASTLYVTDTLPAGMTYIAGTTRECPGQDRDGDGVVGGIACTMRPDTIVTSGLTLADLPDGVERYIYFRASVPWAGYWTGGPGIYPMVNTAVVTSDNAPDYDDDATLMVNVPNGLPPTPTPAPTPTPPTIPDISMSILASQVSIRDFDNPIIVNPSTRVEFEITVNNPDDPGNITAFGVDLSDVLPSGFGYEAGSTRICPLPDTDGDGLGCDNDAPDGIADSGLSLGDMINGQIMYVYFQALVAPHSFWIPPGDDIVINTATVTSDNGAYVEANNSITIDN